MYKFYIGAAKKIILIMIGAVVTMYGMIIDESSKPSVIGMLVVVVGIFLFFWTTFLYHPNIE